MQAAFFNLKVTRRACTCIAEELRERIGAFDNDNCYWLALDTARRNIARLSDNDIRRILHYLYEQVEITEEEAQEIRHTLNI